MTPEPAEITFTVPITVEEDGEGYHAYSPVLKGLHTCGATPDEALAAAVDAAILHIQSLIRHKDPIPLHVEVCPAPPPLAPRTPPGSAPRHYNPQVSVALA